MGLIVCDDCGKEVSDQAEYCVHCGAPLRGKQSDSPGSNEGESNSQNVQTIQQTGKKYKAWQLAGCALVVLGVLIGLGGVPTFAVFFLVPA